MNLVTLNLAHTKTHPSQRRFFSEITSILARWIGLDPISRAERALSSMPDEMLADIGIGRSEIAYAVRYGRIDDGGPANQTKVIALHRRTNHPDGGPDLPHAA